MRRFLAVALALGLVAANALAYAQARAFTHFVRGAARPKKPEDMTALEKASALLLGMRVPRPADWTTPAEAKLPSETLRFPTDDGLELEAWRIPAPAAVSSRTVVLFHGYAASKSQQVAPAAWFHERGAESILVDFRGSGGSLGDETTLGVHEASDVVRSVEVARRLWGRDPILFGTSMGAVAILRAVAAHGLEPRAAILEAPFGRLLATVEKRFGLMGVPAFPGARLLVFWGGVQQGFSGFEHRPVEYAKRVRCPVLLLAGECDPTVTLDETREIYDNLAGPKRLVVIRGAKHESFLKKDPEAWKEAVARFLDELD